MFRNNSRYNYIEIQTIPIKRMCALKQSPDNRFNIDVIKRTQDYKSLGLSNETECFLFARSKFNRCHRLFTVLNSSKLKIDKSGIWNYHEEMGSRGGGGCQSFTSILLDVG